MDQKRRLFILYCVVCSIAALCMIAVIALIVERRFDFTAWNDENSESLSDVDFNVNLYSGNIPESGWNINDVKHHQLHDKFPFSNGMYLGKSDENYLIIDDGNISQIDHDKRDKVKEVIFYKETRRKNVYLHPICSHSR